MTRYRNELVWTLIGILILHIVGGIGMVIYHYNNPDRTLEEIDAFEKELAPVLEQYAFPDPCGLTAVVCPDEIKPDYEVEKIVGKASWYNYDLKDFPNYGATHLTAASRDLPRKSRARITNVANGKSVEVVINDYVVNPKVIIDLSQLAFSQIASLGEGVIDVSVLPI